MTVCDKVVTPFSDWTTEALQDYEERLYDSEISGENVWFERDQILWELSRRLTVDLPKKT